MMKQLEKKSNLRHFVFRMQQRIKSIFTFLNVDGANGAGIKGNVFDISTVTSMNKQADMAQNFIEWFRAIDTLQAIVMSLKHNSDENAFSLDLESLSFQTYLYHIDRMLVKVREQLYTYQYRINELKKDDKALSDIPFLLVKKSAQQCYITILELTHFLRANQKKKLYNHRGFIKKVHALELDASELSSAIRGLNQYTYQQETLQQLAYLEKSLIENLQNTSIPSQGGMLPYSDQLGLEDYCGRKSSGLRNLCANIADDSQKTLLLSLIEIFDNLKRCYVVARKSTINETLDEMYKALEELSVLFTTSEMKQADVVALLSKYYNAIESLRFSTNRDSRCSRNLFEKAKIAKHQMRNACADHELGVAFLRTISITKIERLKLKAKL